MMIYKFEQSMFDKKDNVIYLCGKNPPYGITSDKYINVESEHTGNRLRFDRCEHPTMNDRTYFYNADLNVYATP